MNMGRGLVTAIVLAGVIAGGCGKDDGSPGNTLQSGSGGSPGASGSAGRGGASGSGGRKAGTAGSAGTSSGPPITSAPPAWVRPADCGGIGNRCPNLSGCAERSTCQLDGDVCIPALEPGATSLPSRSAERPYCAAYTCMTFEDASCFCTGDAGETVPACSSPSALAGLCVIKDRSCATTACCDGLTCIDRGGGGKVCEEPCTKSEDCSTGCCTDRRDTGVLTCAPMDACTNPCKKRGEACMPGSTSTPNDCCRGSCVQSENPDFAGCRSNCTTNDQCDTGCCQLFKDSTNGFCAPALYCTCGAVDAPCGAQKAQCCEGNVCAGQSADTLKCYQTCTQPTDCSTNCCRPLSSGTTSICEPAEYCD